MALSLTCAAASLADLRAELQAALLAGAPTTAIRDLLGVAERAEAGAAAEFARQVADAALAEADRIADAAAALAGRTLDRVRAVLADLPLPATTMTEVQMPEIPAAHETAIHAAAALVASALAEQEAAQAALREVEAPVHLARQRLAELAAARSAIGARRAAGDPRAEDAGELLALQLDTENLQALLAQATASAAPARERHAAAVRAAADARVMLATAEVAAHEGALVAQAMALDAALLAVIGRLAETRSSPRPAWSGSPALRGALRDLAARRGEL